MICVSRDDKTKTVLVISEKGYGKRTPLVDEDGEDVYRITNRGGKGVKTINVTENTGPLAGIMDVMETEDLIITCRSGITLRTPISTIKQSSRNTQGVTLIRVDKKDAIASISKIQEEEEEVELDEEGNPIVKETPDAIVVTAEVVADAADVAPTDTEEEGGDKEEDSDQNQ